MTNRTPKVLIRGLSDIGKVREENQDSLLIYEPEDPEEFEAKGVLVALADGMGGLEGGRVASKLAVDAVKKAYYGDSASPRQALEDAVQAANRAIFLHSRDVEGGTQMGSTLTVLAVVGRGAYVAQVGDSRAYRFQDEEIRQVTRDHSLVRELLDRGEIDESSAMCNLHRNILTRGLGLREDVEVDLYEIDDLQEGEIILLSSDGLHGIVHDDEVASCLRRCGTDLQKACEELVRAARDRGGPDNITIALAHIETLPAAEPGASSEPRGAGRRIGSPDCERESGKGWILPLLVFLSFAAGVLLTLLVQDSSPKENLALRRVREQVESTLRVYASTPEAAGREEQLKDALESIRDVLRSAGEVPGGGDAPRAQQGPAGENRSQP